MKASKKKKRKMRAGGGHAKGSAFERKMARDISKWWYGNEGYLWRRPGPGTRFFKKDKHRHSGDIVPSVDRRLPREFPLHIELKCYAKKRLKLDMLLWPKRNPIQKIWNKTVDECRKDLFPMLLLKANNTPVVCVMRVKDIERLIDDHTGGLDGVMPDIISEFVVYHINDIDILYIFPFSYLRDLRIIE